MAADIKAGSKAAARLPAGLLSSPADVAEEGYKALMAGRTVVVPGLPNQISAAWVQATPRWLVRYISGFAARGAGWLQAR
jgi:short-subunit dehydrogenase